MSAAAAPAIGGGGEISPVNASAAAASTPDAGSHLTYAPTERAYAQNENGLSCLSHPGAKFSGTNPGCPSSGMGCTGAFVRSGKLSPTAPNFEPARWPSSPVSERRAQLRWSATTGGSNGSPIKTNYGSAT